jgi:hypothetical protein
MSSFKILSAILFVFAFPFSGTGNAEETQHVNAASESRWETVETIGRPTARHEAALVAHRNKLYLIGGRRINPVEVYDPLTNQWTAKSKTPIELHHFQAVVHGDAIYLVGAMTGGWPKETPLEKVVVYYPEKDEFKFIHSIPESRRRGGAGAVAYKDKIYIVGGITNGHMDGYQPWLDVYDPATGAWDVLDDAPHARDHFQAVVIGGKLYAAAGRTTSQRTEQGFDLTVEECDAYDLIQGKWRSGQGAISIPTQRAGNMAIAHDGKLLIGGGESASQKEAHDEVEAFDPKTETWAAMPKLNRGRHGSGFAVIGDYLYTASGCGNRGGSPELTSLERIKVASQDAQDANQTSVETWHTKTLSFVGPKTSENASPNPFTDYRLLVKLKHVESGQSKTVRGFYAADGNAGQTSANSGNVWQVRFAADQPGEWSYSATLRRGGDAAISDLDDAGEPVEIANAEGVFMVNASTTSKSTVDFRKRGRIVSEGGYFRFEGTDRYWLKGGTDSPENLLAYEDFDGTYRIQASNDEGEASTDDQLHRYAPHIADWKTGDPTWGVVEGKAEGSAESETRGKALIGGMNYLASKGINSSYFLTLNINGDGKDVWPYLSHEDFTRFDCSKLDQWEIVFEHMQRKGILLHVVTQETENETLLDNGDTGKLRKLYYRELIARFAHHPALVWNLGEENGPAEWTPVGQTPAQRIAMADYIKKSDPYNHPVVMHTHADSHGKTELLTPLLGAKSIDGLSFQVDKPESVHGETIKWINASKKAGHRWLVAMDEIGPWMHGVIPDSEDPNHDSIRREVLWGSLMAGAAGVEWYFGAKHPHNDLTSEDWRQRDRMWELTTIAREFFENNLPYWKMESADKLLSGGKAYCLAETGVCYAVYLPKSTECTLDLANCRGQFTVRWFDPLKVGKAQSGSVTEVTGGGKVSLGKPPATSEDGPDHDWTILVQRK